MKLEPGTYQSVDDGCCWSQFTLDANGVVIFKDAGDGHAVTWNVNGADGPSWLEWAAKQLTSGQLKRIR